MADEKKRKDPEMGTPEQPKRARKKAEELQELASKLECQYQQKSQEARESERAAREAESQAQSLRAIAVACSERAELAKAAAAEARKQADRAELSTTKEGRDALKAQDKAEKQEAKEATKAEAAQTRSTIKKIGDSLKDSMKICQRGGKYDVPSGSMSCENVKFGIFKELFARGNCNYSPQKFCESDLSIVVTSTDAASIFGTTKARGGSMYATWVITSFLANYIPASGQLTISYSTKLESCLKRQVATHDSK